MSWKAVFMIFYLVIVMVDIFYDILPLDSLLIYMLLYIGFFMVVEAIHEKRVGEE